MGEVRALEERSLTGTWDISDLQRWKWKASEDPGRGESVGKLQFSRVKYYIWIHTFLLNDEKLLYQ
jgi:hypothetical protein